MKKGDNRISGLAYTGRARPFAWAPWFDLAVKTGEMLVASAYVIGHRADRLARDRREFTRMVEEKFEAAAESAAAMAPALWSLQARGAEIAARQMLARLQAMMAVGRRRITQARLEPRAMRTQGLKAGACACRDQPQAAEQA